MVELEWLRDEIKRSLFHRLYSPCDAPICRDHDDRRIESSLTYLFENIEAILNRHLDVEKYQFRTFGFDFVQTLSPIAGDRNARPETAQRILENVTDIGIVIRNKYVSGEHRHVTSPVSLVRALVSSLELERKFSGMSAGRVKLKVLPCFTSDSTQIFPPCNSTRALQIARPSPVPLGFAPSSSAI